MRNEVLFTKVLDKVFEKRMQRVAEKKIKKTIKSEYGKEAIKMLPVVEEIIDIYCNHYDSVLMSKELILTYTDAKKIIEKFKKGEIFRVIQAENGINVEFEEIPEKSLFDAINMLAS